MASDAFELERRHTERFVDVAERADRLLRSSEEVMGLAQIEAAFADIRVAHKWGREHDPHLAGRLSFALQRYAQQNLVDEPLRWAELTIPLVSDEDPTRPALLVSAATRAINRGELEEARAIVQQAVALARVRTWLRYRRWKCSATPVSTSAGSRRAERRRRRLRAEPR